MRSIILSLVFTFAFSAQAQKVGSDLGKVAVLQWSSKIPATKKANRTQAEQIKQTHREEMVPWITEAAKNGAEIVVTPEFSVTGYPADEEGAFHTREEAAPYIETVPGPSTVFFGQLSRKLGIYIHIGFLEVDQKTNNYHNAVVVLGPQGQIVAHFRKISLFGRENDYLVPGDRHVTYQSPVGRVGLIICADVYDKAVMDKYYFMGVRKFLMGASWTVDNDAIPTFSWAARTWSSYVVAANTTDHPGSGVFAPGGRSQATILKDNGLAYGYIPRN